MDLTGNIMTKIGGYAICQADRAAQALAFARFTFIYVRT